MGEKTGKPKLRVVDPLFADYGPVASGPRQSDFRRSPSGKLFARIELEAADQLYTHRVGGAAWRMLVEIDRLILAQRGRNPVRLYSPRLRRLGLTHHTRQRALRQLTKAGLVTIEPGGRGFSLWVRHLGYPIQR